MKKIDELSNKEILELTDSQIEDLVRVQLAEDGIKLPIKPGDLKLTEVSPPDKVIYEISGLGVYFEDKNVADKLIAIMSENMHSMRDTQYASSVGYDIKYITPLCDNYTYRDGFSLTSKKVYSKELFQQIKFTLKKNQELKKEYDELKKEYNKSLEDTEDTREKILNKIQNVKNAEREKLNKLNIFREYLELADNDKETAWKFMKKVYDVTEEEEKYINDNFKEPKNNVETLSNFLQK